MSESLRDPKRIPAVLKRLEKVWMKCPDLRLGQLVFIGSPLMTSPFYVEDEELISGIEKKVKEAKEPR
jgi:hypothetical protein